MRLFFGQITDSESAMKHDNHGLCLACQRILNKYPDFDSDLRSWFMDLQYRFPDVHTSCGGRGRIEQEILFSRGASKAHYGQSSHNYNMALDLWQLKDKVYTLDQDYFNKVMKDYDAKKFEWYGSSNAVFYELPHIEIRAFRGLVALKLATLVE